ncbi:cytochrome c [Hoeflea sp. AS60]|uniref:c-type cytochrome n=1 Tax=Hoeflea sp. AS60 TaxID=3135780 RepID=UPI003170BA30
MSETLGIKRGLVAASLAVSALCVLSGANPASAQSDDGVKQGRELVEVNCGGCHGVGKADASPHEGAPPFRDLSDRFPIDALEEAFADGRIYSGHPDMPEFIATPEQVEAIIAYIASLQG